MSDDNEEDLGTYPARCFSSNGDGFSGWFATRNQEHCTDFCFWQTLPNETFFTTSNTANPHETTIAPDGQSLWHCASDVTGDETSWNDMMARAKAVPSDSFSPLRCRGGADEVLETTWESWMSSRGFWAVVLCLCSLVLGTNLFLLVRRCFRKKKMKQQSVLKQESEGENSETEKRPVAETNDEKQTAPEDAAAPGKDDDGGSSLDVSKTMDLETANKPESIVDESNEEPEHAAIQQDDHRCCGRILSLRAQKCRTCTCASLLVFANLVSSYLIFVSILSLVEIGGKNTSSLTLKQLTPACTDPSTVCSKGNADINRPSSRPESSPMQSFSYLIASDVQLDWYDGESAFIGRQPYPPPCTESMSCGECSQKFAYHTNTQMKKSLERLINNETDPSRPRTLIMNGDLTAYFHRFERESYESFYHNIQGLERYYPGLGNHDYDHGGATYDGDQWFGPPHCNAAHSVGYLKGGFCGHIPKFLPNTVVRYDSGSLAYSWEEGRYHFVHLHYYPTYENSKIGVKSSMEWLDRDLALAYDAGLKSVLFVHAAQGLEDNKALERVVAGRDVVAIFAGHTHRCLHRKCEGLTRLSVAEVENGTYVADKCLPASVALCGDNADGNFMSLFYLKDAAPDFELPEKRELFLLPDLGDPLCPKYNETYINETDQTLLCRRRVFARPNFPYSLEEQDADGDDGESVNRTRIPIFWSGSASFATFLRADFTQDRITVQALTTEEGFEGQPYVDTHAIPNAVYPYHDRRDLDEVTILIADES